MAFAMAAGCRDSYPSVQPPDNVLYYPVGLAVRQLAPTPEKPAGSSQLVVVNSNYDLRYDLFSGGTVLSVDPDASDDSVNGGQLAMLGSLRIASFGGEVAIASASCPPGWPNCPSACPTLAADPTVAAGGARLVFASRSSQIIYRASMDASGALQCGTDCPFALQLNQLDPYGVSIACSARAGFPTAYAFVSHLLTVNNIGWLTRVNLLEGDLVEPLVVGVDATYTSAFDTLTDRLYVTSAVALNQQLRWFNPLVTLSDVGGYLVPDYSQATFGSLVPGAVARDMAFSGDGTKLWVTVYLYDVALAAQTGAIFSQGGALAVFDLTPGPFGEPKLALQGIVRTCLGAGQIRRLPTRGGRSDLFAVTCDLEGALAIVDSDTRSVVRYVGLNPDTGLPVLGRYPFGLAVEPIDPARSIVPVAGQGYDDPPCSAGSDCQRIYVASFLDNWVNILELDPAKPTQIALVKRIGRGP